MAVKVPVFSFEKLSNVDTQLGPEMKSTGEVLGIASTLEEALFKGLVAAGYKMRKKGGVFITVRDQDKSEIGDIAQKFDDLGYTIYATAGTAAVLKKAGIEVIVVDKIHQNQFNNNLTLIESGKVNYIISTSAKGKLPTRDSVKIRRKAIERAIPCLTSIDTAEAVVNSLMSRYSEYNTELVDINKLRTGKVRREFVKMVGCGNDYIYFACLGGNDLDSPEGLAVRLSDRHFGIGGDGVILICDSDKADAKMRMFNLDGSEGKMCGNGIRCVAKYLYDSHIVNKKEFTIETLSGIKNVKVITRSGEVIMVRVDMGKAELAPAAVPVKAEGESVVDREIEVGGKKYKVTCVSMGNPHCVVFTDNVDNLDIAKIGPAFEESELFPEGVNVEFVKALDDHTLKMRVWERGSGETYACGTGACATAVAACLNGLCKKGEDITVRLLGGDLTVKYTDDAVYMTGDAVKVFDGVVEI